MAMRAIALITLLLTASVARAETRKLSLQEAVQAAMHVDPVVSEAHITDDRAKLGVLRAQLDRFSLKIDGSVQELWNKSNIGGPTIYTCSDPTTPASFCGGTFAGLTLPGMLVPASEQQPGAWTGLSN